MASAGLAMILIFGVGIVIECLIAICGICYVNRRAERTLSVLVFDLVEEERMLAYRRMQARMDTIRPIVTGW